MALAANQEEDEFEFEPESSSSSSSSNVFLVVENNPFSCCLLLYAIDSDFIKEFFCFTTSHTPPISFESKTKTTPQSSLVSFVLSTRRLDPVTNDKCVIYIYFIFFFPVNHLRNGPFFIFQGFGLRSCEQNMSRACKPLKSSNTPTPLNKPHCKKIMQNFGVEYFQSKNYFK